MNEPWLIYGTVVLLLFLLCLLSDELALLWVLTNSWKYLLVLIDATTANDAGETVEYCMPICQMI